MPPPRTTPKWPSALYTHGYCEPLRKHVRFRYKTRQHTTQYLWSEANRERAVSELDRWIGTIINGAPATVPAPRAVRSVHAAQASFFEAKLKGARAGTIYLYEVAVRVFFPDDLPLDADTIEQHLARRLRVIEREPRIITQNGKKPYRRPPYAPLTIAKMGERVRRLLAYCVRKGWLTTNPGEDLPRAKRDPEKTAPVYTDEEVQRIIDYFHARADAVESGGVASRGFGKASAPLHRQYAILTAFLVATGMRISEVLKLKWYDGDATVPHISDREIKILGKGNRWRSWPLTGTSIQVQRVRAAVADIARFRDRNKGYVFPWRSVGSVGDQYRLAVDTLGIEGGNRAVHAFRATCEAIMEREHVNPLVITRLLGHSLVVYEKHYQKMIAAETLAEALELTE